MRHNKKRGMKLGTDASHTKAMKKSLVSALLANDRIKTTLPRAKAIRGDVDRVITWAKRGDLHARRLAIAKVGDKEIVREVFEKAAQGMWADRPGGYTRIMKLGPRKGDNAEIAIIELVTEPVTSKDAAKAKPSKATTKVSKVKGSAETKATEVLEATEVEVSKAAAAIGKDVSDAVSGELEQDEAAGGPEDAPDEKDAE